MARRRIGQESFGFGDDRRGAGSSLDDLTGLIDWAPVEQALAGISNAATDLLSQTACPAKRCPSVPVQR